LCIAYFNFVENDVEDLLEGIRSENETLLGDSFLETEAGNEIENLLASIRERNLSDSIPTLSAPGLVE
jgi:hypothetical protein